MEKEEKKVRWARGFFRAWVVLSIIWLGIVAYTLIEDFPTGREPWFKVEHNGEFISRQEILQAATNAQLAGDIAAEKELRVAVQGIDYRINRRRIEHIGAMSLGATVPPVVLLAFGALIGWAIKGFWPDSR